MLSKGSEASRCGRRPSIEPLEQRQLLSVSALPAIHKPPSAVAAALVVPISVDVGSVSGTVSDSSGAAIAGAVVVIVPTKPSGPPTGNAILPPVRVLFAKTDSSGKFSLPKVPVGTYTASAYKEGFNNATSAAFSVTKDNNTDVSITLTPIVTGSASGSVVDSDGKGIAGALVVLSPTISMKAQLGEPGAPQSPPIPILPPGGGLVAMTDASGNFSFDKVPTGSYTATAFKGGYQKASSASFSVTQGKNTVIPPITLATIPAPVFGSVTGTVTDSGGKPLVGAVVEISPAPPTKAGSGTSGSPVFLPGPIQVAVTDKNGQYTFQKVRTGSYVIIAFARGYQKGTSAPFAVSMGSNTAPTVALTALPTPVLGSVTGTVTDSSGKPLAGAFVEISPAPPAKGGTGGSASAGPVGPPIRVQFTTTDKNGQYTFDTVPIGTYVVSAFAKGYQKGMSAPFTIAKGANTAPTIALTALPTPVFGTVTGAVTDSGGKPIAGASVELIPSPLKVGPDGSPSPTNPIMPPIRVLFATTDKNGQYTINDVPTGSYVVSAWADGYQRNTSAPFTAAQGSNTAPTLALTALPTPVFGSVTGTVTDSAGKAIAGALVEISPVPPPMAGPGPIIFPPPGPVQIAKTDSNGQYTFDKVPTGTYVVTAWADGFQKNSSAPFTVSQGSNTAPTLALTALPTPVFGTVTGAVTDSSGKPIAGASVELTASPPKVGPDGPSSSTLPIGPPIRVLFATTDKNGLYTIDDVPTGSYVVSAWADGYQRNTSAPFTVAQGNNTAPTLALTALPTPVFGSVTGTVTDSAGKPIASALVEISPVPPSMGGAGSSAGLIVFPPPGPVQIAKTDSTGQYTFDKVPVGSYVVTAFAIGYPKAMSAPFTVAEGSNTAPTLVLAAGILFPTPLVPLL